MDSSFNGKRIDKVYSTVWSQNAKESWRLQYTLIDNIPYVGFSLFLRHNKSDNWYPSNKHFFFLWAKWISFVKKFPRIESDINNITANIFTHPNQQQAKPGELRAEIQNVCDPKVRARVEREQREEYHLRYGILESECTLCIPSVEIKKKFCSVANASTLVVDEDVKPIPMLIGNRPAEPVAPTCTTRKRSFDRDDEWIPVWERALERSSPAKKPTW